MALKRYRINNRLADVLALIQVLALSKHAHRSEEGLQKELQGVPRSGRDWAAIATDHPEFFRFEKASTHSISLVARHSTSPTERLALDAPFVGKLVEAAIELHDREEARRLAWDKILPSLVGVIIGGLLSMVTSNLTISSQLRMQEDQEARAVYSRLMGHKTVTRQLHFSRLEALTYSYYHEGKVVLSGGKSVVDSEEAKWWQRKAQELLLEVVRANQSLHADIGIVSARFVDTPALLELTNSVVNGRAIKLTSVPKKKDLAELDNWKETTLIQLDTMVHSEYVKPLDELLAYLLVQLRQHAQPEMKRS